MARHKRGSVRNKRESEIVALNKRISKKKSNLKQRYGVEVNVERIDPSLKGKDLKKAKEIAREFLNRNNIDYQYVKTPTGALPKRKVNEAKALITRANRIKKREGKKLLDLDYMIDGERVGSVREYLSVLKYEKEEFIPLQFKLEWFKDEKALDKWLESKRESYSGDFISRRRASYKEGYITSILNNFGDNSDIKPLIDDIKNMTPNELYHMTMSEDLLTFEFHYSTEHQEEKQDKFIEIWNKTKKV